ncbi:MAG: ATP-dependent helicase [Acidimicrobiales bacterium]
MLTEPTRTGELRCAMADFGRRLRRSAGSLESVERRLLAGCDREQVEAITTEASPLLVVAGAGSGKTRVLTRRIAWRISSRSALAGSVLALTFTRKAAEEMRGRLACLGVDGDVRAGTFHAVALSELKRLARERRVAPPVVLSSKVRLLTELTETERSPSRAAAPKRGGRGRAQVATLAREIAQEIEWSKARCTPPGDYEASARRCGRNLSLPFAEVARLYAGYEQLKARRGVLDFEDLLIGCTHELERDPLFAASARYRTAHVFVDEYQDMNPAQLRLLKAWLGPGSDLCAVGDPDQSIYGWNGSDPAAMARFGEDFPGAKTLRLSMNYRSSPEVVSVASAVLGRRDLPSAAREAGGAPLPTITCYESDLDEAEGVARLVNDARRPGRSWSEVAVLARTNAQLNLFEQALQARKLPCRVAGSASLFEDGHVRELLSSLYECEGASSLFSFASDLRAGSPPGAWEGPDTDVTDSSGGSGSGGSGSSGSGSGSSGGLAFSGDGGAAVSGPGPVAPELVELARLVEEYLGEDVSASGRGFRSWVEATVRSDAAGVGREAVTLTTFHRAKGLEWSEVFVTGLEEGLVPIAHARDAASLAEERRLLYVSCTRAAEQLHCSFARRRSFGSLQAGARSPSRWLEAIGAAAAELEALRLPSPSAAREAIAASRRYLADA